MVLDGEVLAGRYRVIRELGSGGMGTVYLAEHVHLGRRTAVKLLRAELSSDPDAEARFRREALLAAKLMHPAVAQIFDFDRTSDGRFLIAMEYVEGETLSHRLLVEGPLPIAMSLQILRGVSDGLDRAHALGIVHRDIKPENIMLASAGAVKLLDFGVARDVAITSGSDAITSANVALGTPAYMSPEQLVGEPPSAASDVYALGVVVFEMLTRKLPHTGATFSEFRMRRLMQPAPTLHLVREECPPALSAVLARALAIEPAERWPSAGAFARAANEAVSVVATEKAAIPVTHSTSNVTHTQQLETHLEALRLAGRDREVALVRDACEAMRAGRTTTLWIEGDEGAGKSIFFRLAQREASASGAAVLLGRGYHTELAAPYGPWLPILRTALTLRAAKERAWPAISALTGSRSETPAPERADLYDEVAVLLSAAASRGPVFLGIDDIDWCDPASVSMFEYLTHTLSGVPVMLATSSTSDRSGAASRALEASRQVRERLRRIDNTLLLTLRPLGYEPVASWLSGALGREAPEELVRFVYGHTEGNAFFIEQVVRSLFEDGNMEPMSTETARVTLAEFRPPEAVADIVQRRLARMSEPAREVLQIAAVVGREFDVDVLIGLTKRSEDDVLDALDEATEAGVLESVKGRTKDQYRFTQHKIAQVLAQSMNSRRRRRLHAQVAQQLSDQSPGQVAPGIIAWHWYHAGEMAKAFVQARTAARQALELHAYDEALTFGALAAETAQVPTERRVAHELRGDSLRRLDREADAAAAYAHARITGEGDAEELRALRRKELRSSLRAGSVSAATVTAEARKLLEGDESVSVPEHCARQLLLAEALVEANALGEAIEAATQTVATAREINDDEQLIDALLVLGTAHLRAGAHVDAHRVAREACEISNAFGDPYVAARASMLSGAVAAGMRDLTAARRAYAEALRHAERAQVPRLVRQVREREGELG